jgi:PEGA domain
VAYVQNTMLVHASDGKQYTIACTASVRWSKCVWLRVGETYSALWEKHGLAVLNDDKKGKQHEELYTVLASAELPKAAPSMLAEPARAATSEKATCHISSSPPGADIETDGVFAGSTPSTLAMSSGTHKVSVRAAGFTAWTRDVSVTAGSDLNIVANLEK